MATSNNVVFVQWMQDVAVRHALENGCDQELLNRFSATWVARYHHIEYRQQALHGELVDISTWLSAKRKVSCLRQYRFARAKGGDVLAIAETEWVFVDPQSGRPKRIPTEVIGRFEVIDGVD